MAATTQVRLLVRTFSFASALAHCMADDAQQRIDDAEWKPDEQSKTPAERSETEAI